MKKKILAIKMLSVTFFLATILAASPDAIAQDTEYFPKEGLLKESQFNKLDLEDESEIKRRQSAKSVPVWQAARCMAFTNGANTLGQSESSDWEDHLLYYHDLSPLDVYNIRERGKYFMKSLLAKTSVTWKDVHKTYFRECGEYYEITR